MKSHVVFASLLLVLFISGCAQQTVTDIVTSDDGSLQLEISADSLPDGLRVQDIKITRDEKSSTEISYYRMAPDGTTFKKPVRITIETDLVRNYSDIPLLVIRSGSGENATVDLLDNTFFEFDHDSEKITASGDIQHFSEIALWQVPSLFYGHPTSLSTSHKVGDSFEFSGIVKPTGRTVKMQNPDHKEEWGYAYGYYEFSYKTGTTWKAEGKVTTTFANRIMPWRQPIERRSGFTIHQPYNFKVTFKCEREGEERLGPGFNVDEALAVTYTITQKYYSKFSTETVYELASQRDLERTEYIRFSENHKCVAVNSTGVGSGGGGVAPTIRVIQYNGKYIPIDQLHKFTGDVASECNKEEHWHANTGIAKATDFTAFPDPGNCGFGKTKDVPVIEIPKP